MFGSQALETAIGLALLFFLLATATSAAVEALSKALRWRHKQLESVIAMMLLGGEPQESQINDVLDQFKDTSAYTAVSAAAAKMGASYLSAKSFADAAVELARKAENVPAGLRDRLNNLASDVGEDLLAMKAGLEHWFDEAMASLESSHKRWATTWLFVIGLAIAVGSNSSAINVAADMWNDTTVRQAVVAAAESAYSSGADAAAIKELAQTTDTLKELRLPVGWGDQQLGDPTWWVSHIAGWLITALLIMLGGPFWFDLLGKLVSLRTSGKAPEPAEQMAGSNTRRLAERRGAPSMLRAASYASKGFGGLSEDAALLIGRV